MNAWTDDQWIAFWLLSVAGAAAVALLTMGLRAMRSWTAPAPLRLAGAHAAAAPYPHRDTIAVAAPRRTTEAIEHDPRRIDYSRHGIGALSSIQAVKANPALVTKHERQAETDAWINAYADMSGMMPETDKAAEAMRVNIEPALRKARLWLMRNGETGARAALATWRMDTPTGEYPNPYAVTPYAVAHTPLVS